MRSSWARWTRASAVRSMLVYVLLASAWAGCTGQLNERRRSLHDTGVAPDDAAEPVSPIPDPPPDPPPPGVDAGPRLDAAFERHDAAVLPDDASAAPRADAALSHDAGTDAPTFAVDAARPPDGTCTYPTGATGRLAMGSVISPYRWTSAYREDGTRVAFDLTSFHCDAAWDAYTAILFVVGTGWCPNCPDYLRSVAAMSLSTSGTLVVFLESQDESYASATSADARATVDRVVGRAPGLRIGDGENSPRDAIGDQTGSVPSGYFVRRSDMRILANEIELGSTPPWDEMARSPELDWVTRLRGGSPCTEEALEPDDTRSTASPISAGTFSGGICGADDDFFRVDLPGAWQLDLRFRHRDGDLDLFVLDGTGRTVVTSDSADDDESVSYTGPATVRILGYGGARAPYTLTLVAR